MKAFYYQTWSKKRLKKIIDIFGQDWFVGKTVLELGTGTGEIGIELVKLGAIVTFADCRQEHLDAINTYLKDFHIPYYTKLLNQEEKYTFEKKFDLVLHLGILYHIENWKQDLSCALNAGNLCILETTVMPKKMPDNIQAIQVPKMFEKFHGLNNKITNLSQESIESQLQKNNYNYIRFDNSELNTDPSWGGVELIQYLYNWNYENNSDKKFVNGQQVNIKYRRFWLILPSQQKIYP